MEKDEWAVKETSNCIFISGGYIGTNGGVIQKAEELLGHPVNHAYNVSNRFCNTGPDGFRFYYRIECNDVSDFDEFNTFMSKGKVSPYYTGLRTNRVGFKIRSLFSNMAIEDSDKHNLTQFMMFFGFIGAIAIISSYPASTLIPVLVVGTAVVMFAAWVVFAIITFVCHLAYSKLYVPNTQSIPVKNGMVYMMTKEEVLNSNNNYYEPISDKTIKKTIKRINRIFKKKSVNATISVRTKVIKSYDCKYDVINHKHVAVDTVTTFLVLNAPGLNKDVSYDASEFINAYSHIHDAILKSVPVVDTESEKELQSEWDKRAGSVDYMKDLLDSIHTLEYETLASDSMSSAISKEVHAFVHSKNTNKVAYDTLIGQMEDAKRKLMELKDGASTVSASLEDIDKVIALRRKRL